MKKFIVVGLLALGLTAVSQQQASAWYKLNFSIGMNFNWESGNNSYLWGMVNSGQYPGYASDSRHNYSWGSPWANQYPMQYQSYPVMPYAGQYAAQGAQPQHYQTQEPPLGGRNTSQSSSYRYSTHQPIGHYLPATNYYYQTPGYYPSWGYQYQVPAYWYGY